MSYYITSDSESDLFYSCRKTEVKLSMPCEREAIIYNLDTIQSVRGEVTEGTVLFYILYCLKSLRSLKSLKKMVEPKYKKMQVFNFVVRREKKIEERRRKIVIIYKLVQR